MTARIGVELDLTTLRAVRLDGRGHARSRVIEAEWDPAAPAGAVGAVRESLGRAGRVAVAVRLPFLLTKRVRLPPLSVAERREMLRLEPQRYFPIALDDVSVAVRSDDLVFAARESQITGWIEALESLGPVDLIEPGPVAMARALAHAGVRDATVLLDEGRGMGVVQIRSGAVAAVRRIYGEIRPDDLTGLGVGGGTVRLAPWSDARAEALRAALPDVRVEPLPDVRGVPAPFLSAYGAAVGDARDLNTTLAPDDLRVRVERRRRRRLAVAVAVVIAALGFAIASADDWRARRLAYVTQQSRTLEPRAAAVLALQRQMAVEAERAAGIARLGGERPDPLRVLSVLTARLPQGSYIRSLRLSGGEWHIEGFAKQAADVAQALGNAPELTGLRVMAATNRAQVAGETNESFALAFRLAPRP